MATRVWSSCMCVWPRRRHHDRARAPAPPKCDLAEQTCWIPGAALRQRLELSHCGRRNAHRRLNPSVRNRLVSQSEFAFCLSLHTLHSYRYIHYISYCASRSVVTIVPIHSFVQRKRRHGLKRSLRGDGRCGCRRELFQSPGAGLDGVGVCRVDTVHGAFGRA